MDSKYITVRGVRVHNLKNIDLKIPRDKLVIFTGISGSLRIRAWEPSKRGTGVL